MPFTFDASDATAQAALRRVACDLCRSILSDLKSDDRPLDLVVHDARKTVKKLRALVRLVHGQIPHRGRQMRRLRAAAAAVAPLRDSETRLATFDRIAGLSGLAPEKLTGLRAPFAAAHAAAHEPAAIVRSVTAYTQFIRAFRNEAQDWTVPHKGAKTLAPGIERTWDRARTALVAARDPDHPEALHLLRKRVKDIWYQARLFGALDPEGFRPDLEDSATLTELLGEVNDLDTLVAALPAQDDAAEMVRLAERERARLAGRALEMADDLLAEPTEAVVARYRAAWKNRRA